LVFRVLLYSTGFYDMAIIFGIVYRTLFWRAVNTYTEHVFVEIMAKIRSEKEDTYKYLNEISYTL
jgi:hypothetical protein